jgi:hypothetical protein
MNSVDRGVTIARCAAVAILVAGCTTWRVQWVSPEAVIRRDQPRTIEVTFVDSSRVVLDEPRIVGDSLVGENAHGAVESVALAHVAYVAVRRGDGAGNAGLVLLGALAAFVAVAAAVAASW